MSTRVTLCFDVNRSPSLTEEERRLICIHLGGRVNREGLLRITVQDSRSQAANRETAVKRFVELLRDALKLIPPRRETRVSRAQKLRRLSEKKHRSAIKKERAERPTVDS